MMRAPATAAAVAASGWPVRELQGHAPFEPSIWMFDHGDLTWLHNRSMNECFLSLDLLVSPTPAALGAALRPLVQRPGFEDRSENEDRIAWAWPADGNRRMVLTIYLVPPSPGRTLGAGRQRVSLQLTREPVPTAGPERK